MGIDSNIIMKELEKLGDFSLTYHSDIGHLQYLDQLLLAYDETILKQKKIVSITSLRLPCSILNFRMQIANQKPLSVKTSICLRRIKINAKRYYKFTIEDIHRKT